MRTTHPYSKFLRGAVGLAVAGVVGLGAAAVHAAKPQLSSEGPWAKGRVLVKPKAGFSAENVGKVASGVGGTAKRIGKHGVYLIQLPANASEKAIATRLKRNKNLEFAELDRYVAPSLVPNDPYYQPAWHLAKVGAASAWDATQGAGVTVAVLDTGVLATHADLAPNLVPGWNVFNNNSDTSDFNGHGTPVAGTIAALTNNGAGVAGLAGQAKVMPLIITDSSGGSFYSVISQAITYAADKGARVASISFSGLTYSAAVESAAQYMRNKGGVVVVAAGNTGAIDSSAPASSAMIPVSSVESNDTLSSFSTYGNFIALTAPGSGIYSTSRSGGYGIYGGTSFATPVVAATAALVIAANPKLSASDVESILYRTAVDLGAAGRDVYYGYGRVDAAAAVKAALETTPGSGTADTQAPTVAIGAPLGSSTVSGLVPVNVSASDNVGVSKVELRVNGSLVATDSSSPFSFSWDSTRVANGMASLSATAFDAAGNTTTSAIVAVNVANVTAVADTTPPSLNVLSPTISSTVISGSSMNISAAAADNAGSSGITMTLAINGSVVRTTTGGSLSYKWNTRNLRAGTYTLVFTARDAAGNATSSSLQLSKR